jgi:hypothetical protein
MIDQAFSIRLVFSASLSVNRGNLFTAAALLVAEEADNKMKLKIFCR